MTANWALQDRRNVVLTGFMGTGKSTCGRELAELLGYGFVDTDRLIEGRYGPIPTIFAQRGEAAFRDLEHSVAVELADRGGMVIATGGRLMLDVRNADLLASTGWVFCLTAPIETILDRLAADGGDRQRPLLVGADVVERVTALFAERAAGYATFESVDTQDRTPQEIATIIATRLTARS